MTPLPEYPYTFRWSAGVEDFFVKNMIFLKNSFKIKNIWKPNEKVTIKQRTLVEPCATMAGRAGFTSMGAFSYAHSSFGGGADIGRYCSIAPSCKLMGPEHPLDRISTHTFTCRAYYNRWAAENFDVDLGAIPFAGTSRGRLQLGHDVWIGGDVIIRPGISIGTGAVVAAGSVVVKDVPPFAIVGGNPARVIRYRLKEDVVQRILAMQWWQYHIRDLAGLDMADPSGFMDGLQARVEGGLITRWQPKLIDLGLEIRQIRDTERGRSP